MRRCPIRSRAARSRSSSLARSRADDHMNTRDVTGTLTTLLRELIDGPPAGEAYMLNAGDAGLLGSLDTLSAGEASAGVAGAASVAAHVDHLRYGLSLLNRWSKGENPFADADWSVSWTKTAVPETEWRELRSALRHEANRWVDVLRTPRDVTAVELNGIVGSI